MDTLLVEAIKLFGGLAALILFFWSLYKETHTYLKIKVVFKKDNDFLSIYTEVENERKVFSKKIDNAFLIISKENTEIMDEGNKIREHLKLSNENFIHTTDFKILKNETPVYLDNIAFVPLPFYYEENICIGDERLSWSCPIDSKQLEQGIYYVRLFVYRKYRYHRIVQDIFKL